MNLETLRTELQNTLTASGLSQIEFSMKHGISYSYVNKFLKGHMDNPRMKTVEEIERAIKTIREGIEAPQESASEQRVSA